MLNWKYFPDVKISFKSTFKFGLIISLMLPVEAYRVSKNSTAGLQSYQMLVGSMVCARLDQSREPGSNKAYWASGTKCMAYYCPHSTPCSSHLRGSRLIHLFKQQKLCYWATILAENMASSQAMYPIIVFCQVVFQLGEVLQPCSVPSSLVGASRERHVRCGGTPRHMLSIITVPKPRQCLLF